MKLIKKGGNLIICAVICFILYQLRFILRYPNEFFVVAKIIVKTAEKVLVSFGMEGILEFISGLSKVSLGLLIGAVISIVAMILFSMFRNKFEQGSMAMGKDLNRVIGMGLILYFANSVLIFIFAYSIIGLPVAFILTVLSMKMVFIGSISFAITLGYHACVMLKVSVKSSYTYFLLGFFLMMLSISVEIIGCAFLMFIYPVLSLGIIGVILENKFLNKITYSIDYKDYNKKSFDKEKIKDIITKGV